MEPTKESKEKQPCQYCGNKYTNAPVHERFCKENPVNKIELSANLAETPKDTNKEASQEVYKPLIITDIQPMNWDLHRDDVAWYMDEKGNKSTKAPSYIGVIHNTETNDMIPCVLVQAIDGMLLPPFMIAGFIGMYPQFHEFIEPEPTQEQPHDEMPAEPIKSSITPITGLEGDHEQRVIVAPEHAPEPKKKSLLAGIFGRKTKREKEKISDVSDETKDMLREIANPGKAT